MTTKKETQSLANLPFHVQLFDFTQKRRIAQERHLEVLKEAGREDVFLQSVYEMYQGIEKTLDNHIVATIRQHLVWTSWGIYVKGLGELTLGKIMGQCCRYYPGLDILEKIYKKHKRQRDEEAENEEEVNNHRPAAREPLPCNARHNGGRCGRTDPHYHGIDQFETASQLRAHAGFAPGQTKRRGELITWDPKLKSFCWMLAQSLKRTSRHAYYLRDDPKITYQHLIDALGKLRASEEDLAKKRNVTWSSLHPKFKDRMDRRLSDAGKPYHFYVKYKADLRHRWEAQLGAPIGPKKNKEILGLLDLELRSSRKLIQVFLVFLWVVWRRAEGFNVRSSYAQEYLGHHDMQPEEWIE